MKKLLIAAFTVLALGVVPAASGSAKSDLEPGASTSASKFFVSVKPAGGGSKIKAGRLLKVRVSCSRNCRVKVRFKLFTPVGSSTVKGGKYLPKGVPWITGMVLNSRGQRVLKGHLHGSRLGAQVTATRVGTKQRSKRNKLFKFRR